MVALILGSIWGTFYLSIRKKIKSGIIYFLFLLCMLFPVTLDRYDFLFYNHTPSVKNLIIFSLLLIAGFIPWLIFDKWAINKKFVIPDSSLKYLKIIFKILIILSLYSIVYLFPYAKRGLILGALEIRYLLNSGEEQLLPSSIFTTIAVASAALCIFAILFFYISCLTPKLKNYRILLAISSTSYLFNCFAITARDGLVLIPIVFIVLFILFKNSLSTKINKIIRIALTLFTILTLFIISIFSLSRFYGESGSINKLYLGTIGYINQQPYVFDDTVEEQNDFWGFEERFPLINRILGIPAHDVNRTDNYFEWSFGTMYAEFYDSFGWNGVFWFTLTYILYYSLALKWLIKNGRIFGTLLLFCVFLYLAITGMFYYRAGASVSLNIFYLTVSLVPLFVRNLIITQEIKKN